MKKFHNIIGIICLTIFALSCEGQNSSNYQLVEKFDPQRNASQDLTLAIAEAKMSNRNILLDVGGEWCIWCHKLDKFFDENPDLKEYLHNNFVVLKINYSPENKNEEFLANYPQIPGYPHFFILDMNGKFLFSQGSGELEEDDHHDKKKVFEFLKQWTPDKKL